MVATIFAVNLVWFRPFSLHLFYEKTFIKFALQDPELLTSLGITEQFGYPVLSMVSLHAAAKGRPKNLIFASRDKPDLRFRDALDNDVEIVTHADKVLVYDRTIGNDELRSDDLQLWWIDTEKITDSAQAKRSLYARLEASLPCNSPPPSPCCSMPSSRASAVPCRTCQRCCRKYCCTGTHARERSEGQMRFRAFAWTFCSCCRSVCVS
jgi:hypothetical protein